MKYIALIFADEKANAAMTPEQGQAMFGGFMKFTEDIKSSGQYESGNPLKSASTGTTVRVNGGKTVTTDGPYAETKEQLAGYYILECKDLDDATALAARICKLYPHPSVAIEVRPVMQMG